MVGQAVALHGGSLGQSFVATLGESFLRSLYEELLHRGMAFLVTASDDGGLRGFILGSADSSRMMSVILRSPWRFLPTVLWAIVRRPGLIGRVLETLSYAHKTQTDEHAELIAIVVDPAVRSRGVGRRMLRMLHEELAARGVRRYKVTVHRSMIDANRFYAQNGFSLRRTFDLYGVPWNLYVRDVDVTSGNAQ